MSYSGSNLNHSRATLHFFVKARNNIRAFAKVNNRLRDMRKEMKNTASVFKKKSIQMQIAILKMKEAWQKLRTTLLAVRSAAMKLFTLLVAVQSIAINAYGIFQREMATVNALLDESKGKIKEYEKQVMDLSTSMGQSATKLAGAMYRVISLGVEQSEAMYVLQQISKGAVAGMTGGFIDLESAAKSTLATMNALGLESSQVTEIMDIQFKAIEQGDVTYQELAQSMQNVLPAARRIDASLTDIYGSLAYLTKVGGTARRSTTALARAFEILGMRSGQIRDVFNVEVFDDQQQYREFSDIIRDMAHSVGNLTDKAIEFKLIDIGMTRRAARAVVPMIRNYEDFAETLAEVEDNAGAMERAFENATDHILFTGNQAKEAFVNLFRTLGEVYEEEIIALLEGIRNYSIAIMNLIRNNREAVKNIALLMMRLLGLGIVFTSLALAIMSLISPMGLVMSAIVALAAVWWLNFGGIRDHWEKSVKPILDQLSEFGSEHVFPKLQLAFEWASTELIDAVTAAGQGDYSDLFGIAGGALKLFIGAAMIGNIIKGGILANLIMLLGGILGGGAGMGLLAAPLVIQVAFRVVEQLKEGDIAGATQTIFNVLTAAALVGLLATAIGTGTGIPILLAVGLTMNHERVTEGIDNLLDVDRDEAGMMTRNFFTDKTDAMDEWIDQQVENITESVKSVMDGVRHRLQIFDWSEYEIEVDWENNIIKTWFSERVEDMQDLLVDFFDWSDYEIKVDWDDNILTELFSDVTSHFKDIFTWDNVKDNFKTMFENISEEFSKIIWNPFSGLRIPFLNNDGKEMEIDGDTSRNPVGIVHNLYAGGYTGNVGVNQGIPAMLHGQEYVIPAWMTRRMPELISQLEGVRKRKRTKDLSFKGGGSPDLNVPELTYIDDPYNIQDIVFEEVNLGLLHDDINLHNLEQSGIAMESKLGKALKFIAKGAHDTENFAYIVDIVAGLSNLSSELETKVKELQENLKDELEELQQTNMNLDQIIQELQNITASALGEGLDFDGMLSRVGDKLISQFIDQQSSLFAGQFPSLLDPLNETLENQSFDSLSEAMQDANFLLTKLGPEMAAELHDTLDISGLDEQQLEQLNEKYPGTINLANAAYEDMQDELEDYKALLEEMGIITGATTSKLDEFAETLQDTLTQLSSVVSDLNNLGIESDTLDSLQDVIGSVQSGMSLMDNIGGLASTLGDTIGGAVGSGLGSLASMAGGPVGMLAGAGIGAVSSMIQSRKKSEEERQARLDAHLEATEEQTSVLAEIEQNTKDTARNIVNVIAEHPTLTRLQQGRTFLEHHAETVRDHIRPEISGMIVEYERDSSVPFSATSGDFDVDFSSMIAAASEAGHGDLGWDFWADKDYNIGNLSFDELKEANDIIQSIDKDSYFIEQWAQGRQVSGIISDAPEIEEITDVVGLDEAQKQLQHYIDSVGHLHDQIDDFSESVRYKDFGMTEWQSAQEQVDNYRNEIEQMYESAGEDLSDDEVLERIKKSVEKYEQNIVDGGKRIITVMRDVRSSFISAFSDGESALDSFAAGLGDGFNTMFEDISRLVYDINFDDLDREWEDFFGDISDKMVGYDGDDPVGFMENLLSSAEYGDQLNNLVKDTIETSQNMDDMNEVNQVIADSFWEQGQAAGMTNEEIAELLETMGLVDDKARDILDNIDETNSKLEQMESIMSSSLGDAFDDFGHVDFSSFTKSLGQSIYNSVTDSMIEAFIDSEVYHKLIEDHIDFDSDDFQRRIEEADSFEEALDVVGSDMRDLLDNLRLGGLDPHRSQIDQESSGSDDSSSHYGADFHSGASVEGNQGTINNNNYYFSPEIENLYGDDKETLFRDFQEFIKEKRNSEA